VSASPRRAHAFVVWLLLILAAGDARAGAWLMPPGQGQVIAGTAFSGSNRAFDAHGNLIPVPSYKKFELGAYIEYGLTDWLTLVAAPAYDVIRQPSPAPSYTGPGQSGIGGRFRLCTSPARLSRRCRRRC
jgi:protein XagA